MAVMCCGVDYVEEVAVLVVGCAVGGCRGGEGSLEVVCRRAMEWRR